MNKTQLGTSSLWVSKLTMGTMTFGEQNTEQESFSIMDAAWDAGINTYDTAEMYPVKSRRETFGASEEIVGRWVKTKPRDKVIVASKISGPARTFDWIRNNDLDFHPHQIDLAINNSLQRLGLDYIDLYQLHWPTRNVPIFGASRFNPKFERPCAMIEDTLAGLDKHVQTGKIRYIGVSNESSWGVNEFTRQSEQLKLPRIVSIQNAYNLLNRTFEQGLDETCYRENVGLLAYSPLAFGQLTGKYVTNPAAAGRLNVFPKDWSPRYMRDGVLDATTRYMALAAQYGLTSTELATLWCYHQWFVASTIVGATSVPQLAEQLSALAKPLPPELIKAVDAIHATMPNPAH